MAIAKNPKIIMNEKEFAERLRIVRNRKTFYKNKYPYNLLYINKDGRTSGDCVNMVKAILNGYDVQNKKIGYYQKDLSNTGDCTEAELLAQCSDVSQDFTTLNIHPEILYMKGHIGVYVAGAGDYNVIECTKSFGGGIVSSWVDSDGTRRHKKGGVKNGKWTHHGKPSAWVAECTDSTQTNENNASVNLYYPTLKRGNTGESVKELQRKLLAKGYDPQGVDGIFGPGCEKALKAFQKDNGLVVDGIAGPKTWNALNAPTVSIEYTVRAGDTLSKIAKAHGMTTEELLKVNPQIKNPDIISIGQKIKIR